MEGARFEEVLEDNNYKEFCIKMPLIEFAPSENEEEEQEVYECPLYNSVVRARNEGSGNLICGVKLPTRKPKDHWVKRGVALICENSYSLVE